MSLSDLRQQDPGVVMVVRRQVGEAQNVHVFGSSSIRLDDAHEQAGVIAEPRMLEPFDFLPRWQRVGGDRLYGGRSETAALTITLANDDGALSAWSTDGGSVRRRRVDLYVGSRLDPVSTWTRLSYVGWASHAADDGFRVELELRDAAALLEDVALRSETERCWGMGGALLLDGVSGRVVIDDAAAPTDALDIEQCVRLADGGHTGTQIIVCSGAFFGLAEAAFGLYLINGELRARLQDTNGGVTLATARQLDLGVPYRVRLTWSQAAGELAVWVDGDRFGPVDVSSVTGYPDASKGTLTVGSSAAESGSFLSAWVWSLRILHTVRTDGDYRSAMHRSVGEAGAAELGYYAVFPFNEGAFDEVVSIVLDEELVGEKRGGAEWSHSYTGGPDLADKPPPTLIGFQGFEVDPRQEGPRIAPVPIGGRVYALAGGNGLEAPVGGMVVDEGGQILRMQWRARPATITVTAGRLDRIVSEDTVLAGLLAGERIEIVGGANAGVWTVARDAGEYSVQIKGDLTAETSTPVTISTAGREVTSDNIGFEPRRSIIVLDGVISAARFAPGSTIVVTGSVSNNGSHVVVDQLDDSRVEVVGSVVDENAGAEVVLTQTQQSGGQQVRVTSYASPNRTYLSVGVGSITFQGLPVGSTITISGTGTALDNTYTTEAPAHSSGSAEVAYTGANIAATGATVVIATKASTGLSFRERPARIGTNDHAVDLGVFDGSEVTVSGSASNDQTFTTVTPPVDPDGVVGWSYLYVDEHPTNPVVAEAQGATVALAFSDQWECRPFRLLATDGDLDRGGFELRAAPTFPVSARAWGVDTSGAPIDRPGDLFAHLAVTYGGLEPALVDPAMVAALNAAIPHRFGRWVGSEEDVTVGALLDELASSGPFSWGGAPLAFGLEAVALPDVDTATPVATLGEEARHGANLYRLDESSQPERPRRIVIEWASAPSLQSSDITKEVEEVYPAWWAMLQKKVLEAAYPDDLEMVDSDRESVERRLTWHATGRGARALGRADYARVGVQRFVWTADVDEGVAELDWRSSVLRLVSGCHPATVAGRPVVFLSLARASGRALAATLWG